MERLLWHRRAQVTELARRPDFPALRSGNRFSAFFFDTPAIENGWQGSRRAAIRSSQPAYLKLDRRITTPSNPVPNTRRLAGSGVGENANSAVSTAETLRRLTLSPCTVNVPAPKTSAPCTMPVIVNGVWRVNVRPAGT